MIEDLDAVARGEAPFQARQHYNADLLEDLANTGEVIDLSPDRRQTPVAPNHVSVHWVLALGLLLFLSVLINVLLYATR